ncbi:MAG: hypothetical protein BA861_09080 [Desulfobacterales bacterium S3730MH5]|nr:MAG: hypothetical protein BA861_09080 [Desulfobacterales bacterium S3730MH5]OEU80517.1 MAG: hypothetical protein BA865_05675 [Desulfobacterales bacterium S5133MH4]OEU81769.1 MAG: hypothetical protein BA873_00645 [Desulfobulbaceae bacterium C00003063]
MKYLNLGCGSRFHQAWTNIDIVTSSLHVQAHDLSQGIPFQDETFDAVYHSHLLEHFPKNKALGFTQECYRVLKPGGIARVAVPDLERIARTYLQALEKALQGKDKWQHNYEWIMLELYDQAVRERPAGDMLEYLKQDPIPNKAFVYKRLGGEARHIVHGLRSRFTKEGNVPYMRRLGSRFRYFSYFVIERLISMLLTENDYRALQIGRFRMRGEVHHWMYDRYSLAQLLKQAGFHDPQSVGPTESQIEDWTDYHLDTEPDGTVYKPDSLYMEAFKP